MNKKSPFLWLEYIENVPKMSFSANKRNDLTIKVYITFLELYKSHYKLSYVELNCQLK